MHSNLVCAQSNIQSESEDFDPYDNRSFRYFGINTKWIAFADHTQHIVQQAWHPKLQERKARRELERQRLHLMERRRGGERERKAMLSTSTRC